MRGRSPLHQAPEQVVALRELQDVAVQGSFACLLQSFPGQELQTNKITGTNYSNY